MVHPVVIVCKDDDNSFLSEFFSSNLIEIKYVHGYVERLDWFSVKLRSRK